MIVAVSQKEVFLSRLPGPNRLTESAASTAICSPRNCPRTDRRSRGSNPAIANRQRDDQARRHEPRRANGSCRLRKLTDLRQGQGPRHRTEFELSLTALNEKFGLVIKAWHDGE